MSESLKMTRANVPVRFRLVLWLFVLSAVAFLDRTNISIAGVEIAREFHLDNTRLGWVFSAFLIGYAIFQIPGGAFAQRLGPRRSLAICVIWWGVFTALTALVPPGVIGALFLLVLVRFALGAGEATMYPASNRFIERWFPMNERGKANGLIFAGVGAGSGLTPPLVTAIILYWGWRASFWFSALVGLAVGAIWYFSSRDTPEEHPRVSSAELEKIVRGREDVGGEFSVGRQIAGESLEPGLGLSLESEIAAAHKVKSPTPWAKVLASKEVLALFLSYFSFCYVAWIYFSWFYIYLVQVRGLNLKSSALYTMIPFIAMTVGCLLGGVASDWLAQRAGVRLGRCWLSALALIATAVLLVVGSRVHQAQSASIVLACGAGALYLSQSCYWSMTADYAGRHSGVVSGMMNMGGQIGGAVTASVTPLIAAHFGWQASFMTAAVLAALGGLAWLLVDPKARLVQERKPVASRA